MTLLVNLLSSCCMAGMPIYQPKPFFLLPEHPYQIDADDYKTKLMDGLSTAWKNAHLQVKSAQQRYKEHHDKRENHFNTSLVIVSSYTCRRSSKTSSESYLVHTMDPTVLRLSHPPASVLSQYACTYVYMHTVEECITDSSGKDRICPLCLVISSLCLFVGLFHIETN
jgi:hypothetical protein